MYSAPAGKNQLKRLQTERKLAFFCERRRLKYRKARGVGLADKP
jgi:hypothetical protein